jgi:hypothetical protein
MEKNKLYRVTLRGMTSSVTGVSYGISYVVAKNTEEAYQKLKKFVDENDLGYSSQRELDKVELLAEDYQYTGTGTMLFL